MCYGGTFDETEVSRNPIVYVQEKNPFLYVNFVYFRVFHLNQGGKRVPRSLCDENILYSINFNTQYIDEDCIPDLPSGNYIFFNIICMYNTVKPV